MSFNDISKGPPPQRPGGSVPRSPDSLELGDQLQILQRQCYALKEKVTEMRRRKVGPAEKTEIDLQIKTLRENESRLKIQIDSQMKLLDSQPRSTEVAQKRIALGKLLKDHEKIKAGLQQVCSDALMIKVTQESAPRTVFSRTGASPGEDTTAAEKGTSSERRRQLQEPQILHAIQGQDVDDAIREEREREIIKMNQDLVLVNEMMRDMANIVQSQGAMVEEIHTSAEASHDRAKAGLEQVQQAAAYQPTCAIS